MSLLHEPHHDGSPLYLSDEAPATGSVVTVRLRTDPADPVAQAWIRTTYDAEPTHRAPSLRTPRRSGPAVREQPNRDPEWLPAHRHTERPTPAVPQQPSVPSKRLPAHRRPAAPEA